MKTKHLLMAGLGLISFVGMSISSVQKAFGQSWIFQDNQGRPYLAVPPGYGRPDSVCTSDNQYCFNVSYSPSKCYPQGCIFPLSLTNRITNFGNPSDSGSRNRTYADLCRSASYNDVAAIATDGVDCTNYGYPEEVNEYKKRRLIQFEKTRNEALKMLPGRVR